VRPGLGISFAEQAHGVYQLLGTARGARGTIHFTPADGPAGVRSIFAIVSEGGVPRQRQLVTRYFAPGPARPGRVHGLRVVRRGNRFQIGFGAASNAVRYVVRISASDGRHIIRLVGPRGHSLTLPALGYTDRITVSVAGLSRLARQGPAVRAGASWTSTAFRPSGGKAPHRARRRSKR
jgi:hypothetical protein